MKRHPSLLIGSIFFLNTLASFAQSIPQEAIVSAPDREHILPSSPGDTSTISPKEGSYSLEVDEKTKAPVGFSISNMGANRIVPEQAGIGTGPERDFQFNFQSRARQNIYLAITDMPTEYLSQLMESYLYFFPRINLPAVQWDNTNPNAPRLNVTLPTGEPMVFDGISHEVVGGAIEELAPIDRGPDRFKRKFAQIKYHGSGVMIRVDRRGGDPRLGTIATITQGTRSCKIPSSQLFNQDEHSEVEFLFPSDAEFNSFLIQKCKMSFL